MPLAEFTAEVGFSLLIGAVAASTCFCGNVHGVGEDSDYDDWCTDDGDEDDDDDSGGEGSDYDDWSIDDGEEDDDKDSHYDVWYIDDGEEEDDGSDGDDDDGNEDGLSPDELERIPEFSYSNDGTGSGDKCSICLEQMQDGERCRRLRGCRHAFHAGCIDEWLTRRRTCPSCRSFVQVPPAVITWIYKVFSTIT